MPEVPSSIDVTNEFAQLNEPVAITDEQVAFYRERGWVKIENVLPRSVAHLLRRDFLQFAPETRPPEADFRTDKQNFHQQPHYRKQHLVHRDLFQRSPVFRQAIMSLRHGSVACRLMDEHDVQLFRTSVFEKLPTARGGGITRLHQDAPYVPMDRNGGLSIWIALDDLEVDAGTLQFVEGSHLWGSLGRDEVYWPDNDYLKQRADKEGWEVTDGLCMNAGDATVHHDLTVHMAGENASDTPRLAITSLIFPSHALFNGSPHPAVMDRGMVVNHPFPREYFPSFPH